MNLRNVRFYRRRRQYLKRRGLQEWQPRRRWRRHIPWALCGVLLAVLIAVLGD